MHIPANPEYSSLNLATAVQVLCYELRMAHLSEQEGGPLGNVEWDLPPAKSEALERYFEHLQETLETLDFLNPDNPRQTMTRLRRLYHRIRPDEMELSILRGVLTATQNYIYHTDKRLKALDPASKEGKPLDNGE